MATMKQAIKEAFEQSEGALSKEVIRQFVDERYPGIWQPATLTAHLYACAINNPKSYIHHPHAKRFLYKNADGTFELYDEEGLMGRIFGRRTKQRTSRMPRRR